MTTERRRPKPAAYHLMTMQEKAARSLGQVRDASVRCPQCEMSVMPADLLAHIEQRCAGRPEPGAGAKWVNARDAIVRRVPKGTLSYWVQQGFVRARGGQMDREYLLGDLALRIARWRGFRRR